MWERNVCEKKEQCEMFLKNVKEKCESIWNWKIWIINFDDNVKENKTEHNEN